MYLVTVAVSVLWWKAWWGTFNCAPFYKVPKKTYLYVDERGASPRAFLPCECSPGMTSRRGAGSIKLSPARGATWRHHPCRRPCCFGESAWLCLKAGTTEVQLGWCFGCFVINILNFVSEYVFHGGELSLKKTIYSMHSMIRQGTTRELGYRTNCISKLVEVPYKYKYVVCVSSWHKEHWCRGDAKMVGCEVLIASVRPGYIQQLRV